MKRSIKRIYHPYWRWEEVEYNMWGKVDDRYAYLKKAIEFTGDHIQYGKAMLGVIDAWKYSCEHNLSNTSSNRRAWIGHAACAYSFRCPEDIVRAAWAHLTDKQRELANDQADIVIKIWEEAWVRNI